MDDHLVILGLSAAFLHPEDREEISVLVLPANEALAASKWISYINTEVMHV